MTHRYFVFTLLLSILISFVSISNLCLAAEPAPASAAPQNLKFRLDPVKQNDSYDWWREWRPIRGDKPAFVAKLSAESAETDKVKHTHYTFTLDVSAYDGYCMNFKDSKDPDADIVFREEDNPDTDPLDYTVSNDGTTLTVTCTTPTFVIPIKVYVYDYGAHGILTATVAINKNDGTPSNDASAVSRIAIPLDNNGNDIADGWKDDKAKNYNPWDDDEAGPGNNTNTGDGITVFEEYRGFMVKGNFTSTEPVTKKDLFIYSHFAAYGYGDAENLPGVFAKHLINLNEMDNGRQITRYRCGTGKSYSNIEFRPQKAVEVINASDDIKFRDQNPGYFGIVLEDPHPPYKVEECLVYPHHIEAELSKVENNVPAPGFFNAHQDRMIKNIIGHEIGHCVRLYDIGSSENVLKWSGGQKTYGYDIMETFAHDNIFVKQILITTQSSTYNAVPHTSSYMLVSTRDRDSHLEFVTKHIIDKNRSRDTTKPKWTPPDTDDSDNQQNQNSGDDGATNTPALPDSPTGLSMSAGNGQVRLSWTAASGTITGYQYRYRESGGSWGSWISAGQGWSQH